MTTLERAPKVKLIPLVIGSKMFCILIQISNGKSKKKVLNMPSENCEVYFSCEVFEEKT